MFRKPGAMGSSPSSSVWAIFAASTIAIILMTLFSFILSVIRKKQFTEPVILNDLLRPSNAPGIQNYRHPLGWIIHYVVGLVFVICYHLLWSQDLVAPTVFNGAMLGAACGLIGIAGWHITLSIHPHPPVIDLKEFYVQLFFAHVIFGIVATLTYTLA